MTGENRLLIIGCGVSGLTCGIKLQENGFQTKIVASKLPPETTSNIAPAYWYPYKVNPPDKVLKWGALSYEYFSSLKDTKKSGVSFIKLIKLYDREVPLPSWTEITTGFKILSKSDLPDGYGFGFSTQVPLIEAPVYMRYLLSRYVNSGGEVSRLNNDIESVDKYAGEYGFIINCSGLGSYKLFNDKKMFPIRGQLVRTTNPGINNIYSDQEGHLALSYIVPRANDCILGGTADENNWDEEVKMDISDRIMQYCAKIQPLLKDSAILNNVVGLRPGREQVRLEYEEYKSKQKIVHNYGHGGAGFTLSWGCAEEVLQLVKEHLT